MDKELFKWDSLTCDLRDKKHTRRKKEKTKVKEQVSSWLTEQSGHPQTDSVNEETDDIDIWLDKVRRAADVAQHEVVMGCGAERASSAGHTEVSSLFSTVVADYIPDYRKDKSNPENEREVLSDALDDRYDTMTEAKSILDSWMRKKTQIDQEVVLSTDMEYAISSGYDQSSDDDLSTTLNNLRSTPVARRVASKLKTGKRRVKNPAVSIAARQQQAKERRHKIEEDRVEKMKEAARRKVARAEAEKALLAEKERKAAEEKEEEDKIRGEMGALRKRLRKEQQHKLISYEQQVEAQSEAHAAGLAAEYRRVVMENAEGEMKKKQLLATRHVLIKQLQQAEGREMRQAYSLMQNALTKWKEAALEGRVQYNKASAFYEWRSQLRAWRCWKQYCNGERAKREERIREVVFREHKKLRTADLHHQKKQLRLSFCCWRAWCHEQVAERVERALEQRRKRLMDQCLAQVQETAANEGGYVAGREDRPVETSASLDNAATAVQSSEEIDTAYNSQKYQRRNKIGVNFDVLRKTRQNEAANNDVNSVELATKGTEEIEADSITKNQKGAAEPVPPPPTFNPWIMAPAQVLCPPKLDKKKVPAALQGMEDRAEQRRLRRDEILRRKEEKIRHAELARLAEEKRRVALEEEIRQQERNRRLKEIAAAKDLERAKQNNLQEMKNKTLKAINHYNDSIRRNLVLKPLQRLCQKARDDAELATRHRERSLLHMCFRTWEQALKIKRLEKEETATIFWRRCLLRNAFIAFKRGAQLQESYTRIAVRHCKRTTRVRALREWARWVKLAAARRQVAMEQAVELDIRLTLRRHFLSWRRLTPLLVREREGEVRKARMRTMIADLLPDYAPPT